jgi:hypothetical protein
MPYVYVLTLILAILSMIFIKNPRADYDKRPFRLASTVFYTATLLLIVLAEPNIIWLDTVLIAVAFLFLLFDYFEYPDTYIKAFLLWEPIKEPKYSSLFIREGKIIGKKTNPKESISQGIRLAREVNDLVIVYVNNIKIKIFPISDIDYLFNSWRLAMNSKDLEVVEAMPNIPERDSRYWWKRFKESINFIRTRRRR